MVNGKRRERLRINAGGAPVPFAGEPHGPKNTSVQFVSVSVRVFHAKRLARLITDTRLLSRRTFAIVIELIAISRPHGARRTPEQFTFKLEQFASNARTRRIGCRWQHMRSRGAGRAGVRYAAAARATTTIESERASAWPRRRRLNQNAPAHDHPTCRSHRCTRCPNADAPVSMSATHVTKRTSTTALPLLPPVHSGR